MIICVLRFPEATWYRKMVLWLKSLDHCELAFLFLCSLPQSFSSKLISVLMSNLEIQRGHMQDALAQHLALSSSMTTKYYM